MTKHRVIFWYGAVALKHKKGNFNMIHVMKTFLYQSTDGRHRMYVNYNGNEASIESTHAFPKGKWLTVSYLIDLKQGSI